MSAAEETTVKPRVQIYGSSVAGNIFVRQFDIYISLCCLCLISNALCLYIKGQEKSRMGSDSVNHSQDSFRIR